MGAGWFCVADGTYGVKQSRAPDRSKVASPVMRYKMTDIQLDIGGVSRKDTRSNH